MSYGAVLMLKAPRPASVTLMIIAPLAKIKHADFKQLDRFRAKLRYPGGGETSV